MNAGFWYGAGGIEISKLIGKLGCNFDILLALRLVSSERRHFRLVLEGLFKKIIGGYQTQPVKRMDKRMLTARGFDTIPMSPVGLYIVDGNGVVLAHLIYEVDKDKGVAVEYDEATVEVYESWRIPIAPMPVPQLHGRPIWSHEELVVMRIPTKWVETRSSLPLAGDHWLGAVGFLPRDRQLRWYTFCTKDLGRSTVLKILRSYDIRIRTNPSESSPQRNHVSWKTVFEAYQRYWSTLSDGTLKVTNLEKLERQLKGELLFYKQTPPPPLKDNRILPSSASYWTTRCAGGGLMYNIVFPCPSTPLNEANLTVMDMEEAICKGFAPVCRSTSSAYYFSKLAHFPVLRNGQKGKNLPEVDRVLIGVCEKCITACPIFGGTTTRTTLQLTKLNFSSVKMDPIYEISDNIMVLWTDPLNLIFFLLRPSATHNGYRIVELYRLNFPNMRGIWDRIAEHRLDYIPVLRVYKGHTPLLDGVEIGEDGYPFNSIEDRFYGLSFVSHIYGVESFKPSSEITNEVVVQSLEPRYYSNNGRHHLPLLRTAQCSGKGHGLFVLCNNEAIAVSWDSITWLFDKLTYLKSNKFRNVHHVEVIYDEGLLLVVDENIIFMKLSMKVDPPNMVNGINLTEPVLEVKPVRIIRLDFFPWYRKITQVELDFDNGLPFLFIVAERLFRKVGRNVEEDTDGLDFIMKRIDFLADEPEESNN
ncbi:hypothetical protein Ocin01_03656 [Orchesella cincta]|uniref:Uncharacterized protein n=1 Tax=Orchesella cincta TaxID=48709 RepID=A0A1D2NCR0_ORCCI|nr:hypothetical protein Ocin01_03656 [Orchesella cincta]